MVNSSVHFQHRCSVAIFTVDDLYDRHMYEITSSVEDCASWRVNVKLKVNVKVKVKIMLSLEKPEGPCGFQKFEASRLHDSWFIKVLSLSALRTGHLYPPGNIAGTNLC